MNPQEDEHWTPFAVGFFLGAGVMYVVVAMVRDFLGMP